MAGIEIRVELSCRKSAAQPGQQTTLAKKCTAHDIESHVRCRLLYSGCTPLCYTDTRFVGGTRETIFDNQLTEIHHNYPHSSKAFNFAVWPSIAILIHIACDFPINHDHSKIATY